MRHRQILPIAALAAVMFAAGPGATQTPPPALAPQQETVAPPKPYKAVTVTLPAPNTDPSLDAFRKQLGDAAKRKDRAALAALVVPKGFFWQREDGDSADAKKSGID